MLILWKGKQGPQRSDVSQALTLEVALDTGDILPNAMSRLEPLLLSPNANGIVYKPHLNPYESCKIFSIPS